MVFSVDSPDWTMIHKTTNAIQAEFLRNELENQEITAIIVNQKDSMYPIFGQARLYVEERNAAISRVIIDAFLTSNEEQ
jgi:hypothetical protein